MGNLDLFITINGEYMFKVLGVDYSDRWEAIALAGKAFQEMCIRNSEDPTAIRDYWLGMEIKTISVIDREVLIRKDKYNG